MRFVGNDGTNEAFERLACLARTVIAAAGGEGKCLRLEFSVAPQQPDGALTSTGLLVVNPPWTLASELRVILPELERPLGQGGVSRYRLELPRS